MYNQTATTNIYRMSMQALLSRDVSVSKANTCTSLLPLSPFVCTVVFRSLLWFTINYVALSCARGIPLRSATPRRSALAVPRR